MFPWRRLYAFGALLLAVGGVPTAVAQEHAPAANAPATNAPDASTLASPGGESSPAEPSPARAVLLVKEGANSASDTVQKVRIAFITPGQGVQLATFSRLGVSTIWYPDPGSTPELALMMLLATERDYGLPRLAATVKHRVSSGMTWSDWINAALTQEIGTSDVRWGPAGSSKTVSVEVGVLAGLPQLAERLRGYGLDWVAPQAPARPEPLAQKLPDPWLAASAGLGAGLAPWLFGYLRASAKRPRSRKAASASLTDPARDTVWLIAVFLDRLIRAAARKEREPEAVAQLEDARTRLLREAQRLVKDGAWESRSQALLVSLFRDSGQANRQAARKVLEDLAAAAAGRFTLPDSSGPAKEGLLKATARLHAVLKDAVFSRPPDTAELMEAFLDQLLMSAAQETPGRKGQDRVDHYRELLRKAAGELAAEASAAGGHGELLRRLFSMRDTAARKDAEGLVWRLLGLAKDSTPSEPDGFPSKLITAVDRLRFQLPIPHALPPAVAGGAPSAASSTPRPEQAMQAELEQLRRNEQAANASIQDWRRKYEMLLAKVRQLEMRATPSDSVPQDGAEPSSSAKKEVDGLRSEAEALRRQLSQAHKEQEGLTRRLKQAEESRAQVLQVQDAALSEVRSLKVKVEAGQREGARLQEERDQQKSLAVVSAKLVSALEREKAELTKQETELRRRITKLETRVGATEGQLATSAAEIQRLEALVAARQADVTRLERTCERWLRAEPELQEVRALFSRVRLAVVELRSRYPKDEVTDKTALLLFYSLANLVFAISSGETVLRAAMLVNLRQIASSLQACPHFPAMSGALARIDPRIATLHEEWSTSAEARPGRELFQRSVQCLRARHALELESFYYDVDEQERVCLTG